MKLENYSPTFRQVLFKQVFKEKVNKSGLIISAPGFSTKTFADVFENEKEHVGGKPELEVVKVGKDCTTILPNDIIVIMQGIQPQPIDLEDGNFFSINEGQIIGHERELNDLQRITSSD